MRHIHISRMPQSLLLLIRLQIVISIVALIKMIKGHGCLTSIFVDAFHRLIMIREHISIENDSMRRLKLKPFSLRRSFAAEMKLENNVKTLQPDMT